MKTIHFPIEPLIDKVLNGRETPDGESFDLSERLPALTDRVLGEVIGVSRETVIRWRRNGLALHRAEDVAHDCGFMPCEIWADYYEKVIAHASD